MAIRIQIFSHAQVVLVDHPDLPFQVYRFDNNSAETTSAKFESKVDALKYYYKLVEHEGLHVVTEAQEALAILEVEAFANWQKNHEG